MGRLRITRGVAITCVILIGCAAISLPLKQTTYAKGRVLLEFSHDSEATRAWEVECIDIESGAVVRSNAGTTPALPSIAVEAVILEEVRLFWKDKSWVQLDPYEFVIRLDGNRIILRHGLLEITSDVPALLVTLGSEVVE